MTDKKVNGLPQVQQPPQGPPPPLPPTPQNVPSTPQAYVPITPHPYGIYPNQNSLYGPPPTYEQTIINPQFLPPMFIPFPAAFAPIPVFQQTFSYPVQAAPMRPIYFPNAFDSSGRFDVIGQPALPPQGSAMAPNAPQLAAISNNQNLLLGQKKGSFW